MRFLIFWRGPCIRCELVSPDHFPGRIVETSRFKDQAISFWFTTLSEAVTRKRTSNTTPQLSRGLPLITPTLSLEILYGSQCPARSKSIHIRCIEEVDYNQHTVLMAWKLEIRNKIFSRLNFWSLWLFEIRFYQLKGERVNTNCLFYSPADPLTFQGPFSHSYDPVFVVNWSCSTGIVLHYRHVVCSATHPLVFKRRAKIYREFICNQGNSHP